VYILDGHKKNIIYVFDAKFAQYHKEERKTANIILNYRQVISKIFYRQHAITILSSINI